MTLVHALGSLLKSENFPRNSGQHAFIDSILFLGIRKSHGLPNGAVKKAENNKLRRHHSRVDLISRKSKFNVTEVRRPF